jgi:hypothetical protein
MKIWFQKFIKAFDLVFNKIYCTFIWQFMCIEEYFMVSCLYKYSLHRNGHFRHIAKYKMVSVINQYDGLYGSLSLLCILPLNATTWLLEHWDYLALGSQPLLVPGSQQAPLGNGVSTGSGTLERGHSLGMFSFSSNHVWVHVYKYSITIFSRSWIKFHRAQPTFL